MSISTIKITELYELMRQGRPLDLLDVRTRQEYEEVHADGARNIPLGSLTPALAVENRRSGPDDPIYVICRSGGRSMEGCRKLVAAGLKNVVNVEGGTLAWQKAGLPVVPPSSGSTGSAHVVRLLLWAVVLIGLALTLSVHSYFAMLAMGGWVGLIISGGCCPLAGCSLPPDRPGASGS